MIIEIQQDKNVDVLTIRWFELDDNTEIFQITLRNRWNSHWEPVIQVFDVHDIFHDGMLLDKSSTAPTKNERLALFRDPMDNNARNKACLAE